MEQQDYDYRTPNQYTGDDMYQLAVRNNLAGYSMWPIPKLARKSFDLIAENMTQTEKPVFCFMARVNKNTFDNSVGTNMNAQDSQTEMQPKPGFLKSMMTFMFGWLLTPFDMSQEWCAFVLTDKNKLYYSHYVFPFTWSSDVANLQLLPNDMQLNINNFKSNPSFGALTIGSLRGQHQLVLTWKKRTIHNIYQGLNNNVDRNGKKFEDEDENIMY